MCGNQPVKLSYCLVQRKEGSEVKLTLLACIDRTFSIPTISLINMLQWVRVHFQKSGFV